MAKGNREKTKYEKRLEEFIKENGYVPRLFNAYNKKAYHDYVPCLTANPYPSGKSSVMVIEIVGGEENPGSRGD